MSDVFISYARSTASQAQHVAAALRAMGYSVWIDDDLPAHRAYSPVIEEELTAAKAAVVIWSADAARSEWVMSEANRAREDGKLVQLRTDLARLPMPFDTIQCVDLSGWSGEADSPGWRKVVASIGELIGLGSTVEPPPVAPSPLALPSKPSIAVMPFANLSGDPDQDYFADGMVTEITTALSRIPTIFVIASSSTLSLKGAAVTPQDAGRRLGVRFVLEGNVRKAGNRVRIAVQLIDAAEGAQIWAERFDDTLEDIFELQDKVALAVAAKIEPTLMRAEIERVIRRPTADMGSYDLSLRATPLVFTFAKEAMLRARDLLDRAIALDPVYGQALAINAFAHGQIASNRWSDDPRGDRHTAVDLARRALDASPDDPTVLPIVAETLVVINDSLETALGLVDRAISINPGNSFAWFSAGWMAILSGQSDLGAERLETSMRLDPVSLVRAFQLSFLGVARFNQRRLAEAVALLEEAAQLNASYIIAPSVLAACYGHLGRSAKAHDALLRRAQLTGQTVDGFAAWAFRDQAQRRHYLAGVAMAGQGAA